MGFPLSDLLIPSRKDKAKLYGTKPVYVTPGTSAGEALSANLENFPKAKELAGKVNAFNFDELLTMRRKADPAFDTRAKLSSDILTSRLKGEFTKSELDQLQLASASRGVGRGTGGRSPFDKLNLARDLGLNRWEETQEALDSNARWTESMARLTEPALFNIGSSFVSKEDQINYNNAVSVTNAAPNPGARGAFDSKMGVLGMMLGAYGGAGYQGAYQPSGQPQQPSAPTQYFLQNANGGGGTGGAPQGWGGGTNVPGGSYSGGEAFDQFGTWNF